MAKNRMIAPIYVTPTTGNSYAQMRRLACKLKRKDDLRDLAAQDAMTVLSLTRTVGQAY